MRNVFSRLGLAFLAGGIMILLFIQTPWGALTSARLILAVTRPLTPYVISVGGVRGNWFTTLELRDAAVRQGDGTMLLGVDTLRVRHSLLGLPFGSYHARRLRISGPHLWIASRESVEGQQAGSKGGYSVRVDRFEVRSGQITAPGALRLTEIEATGQLDLGSVLAAHLDTLQARLWPEGARGSLFVRTRADLVGGRLDLDSLSVTGPGSKIGIAGYFARLDNSYDADIRLSAAPIALADVGQFPALRDTAEISMHLTGEGALLRLLADTRLFSGGRIVLDVEGTPALSGPVAFTLRRADIRNLGLAGLGMPGQLSANLSGYLAGPSLDKVRGAVQLSVFDTHAWGHQLDSFKLTAEVDSGAASFRLESGIWGAAVSATGRVQPFGEVPVYELEGRFSGLNAAHYVNSHVSSLNGTYRLAGKGTTAQARLEIKPSTYNRLAIDNARLDATLGEGLVEFGLRAAAAEGSVAASGMLDLGDTLRFAVQGAEWNQLDVAAFLGLAASSAFAGHATLAGSASESGFSTQAELNLGASHLGSIVLRELAAHGYVREGSAQLSVNSMLDLGNVTAILNVAGLASGQPSWDLRGLFREIDVAALAASHRSNLHGMVHVVGSGPAPIRMDLRLGTSRVNHQAVDSAWVTAHMHQGQMVMEGRVLLPSGGAEFLAEGVLFGGQRAFSLRQGRFAEVDLGKLLGVAGLETRLTGQVVSLDVDAAEAFLLHGAVRLDSSWINNAAVVSGGLRLQVRGLY